jgi:hypothetical protein
MVSATNGDQIKAGRSVVVAYTGGGEVWWAGATYFGSFCWATQTGSHSATPASLHFVLFSSRTVCLDFAFVCPALLAHRIRHTSMHLID